MTAMSSSATEEAIAAGQKGSKAGKTLEVCSPALTSQDVL